MPFTFGLETEDGFPHQGVLDFADTRIDPTTGTIEVRGVVPNPQGRFIPGSRVRIRVPISQQRPAVLVPDTAVLSDQDKKYMLVLDEKNVVHRRDVRLGKLLDDGMRIILPESSATTSLATASAGLSPQDRIVTIGIQMARINYPVEPVETVSPAAPAATQPVAAR
jgi:multidrug efflux pump subunit AcrA (membrane-fusion protein)